MAERAGFPFAGRMIGLKPAGEIEATDSHSMLQEYVDWWARQMLDLVPERLRERPVGEIDALLIEPEGDIAGLPSAFSLGLRRNGKLGPLGRFPLDAGGLEAAREAAAGPGRAGDIWLRLPAALLLEKRLTLPLATERDLKRVLAYEMDRETPFTAGEVWWTHTVEARDRAQGKLQLLLSLVPKAPVADLIEALEHGGLAPTSLDMPLASGQSRRIGLRAAAGLSAPWRRRAVPLGWAACGALALLAVVLPFLLQSLALDQVENRIAELTPAVAEAEKLRVGLEGNGGGDVLAAERRRLGDPLAALAAVTALFPDDTYLTDFTMEQRKLTLNGQGVGPAKLISALAGDPTFKDPAFAAPVTRTEGSHADGFSITAEAVP
jgi:general secretion pathway protein L